MPALQRLDLDYNDLTTLPALDLPKLDWLGLAHNQIDSISTTTALPELDAISLVGNKLTNVAPLRSYSKVSTVFVNGNQITDLSNLTTGLPVQGTIACDQAATDTCCHDQGLHRRATARGEGCSRLQAPDRLGSAHGCAEEWVQHHLPGGRAGPSPTGSSSASSAASPEVTAETTPTSPATTHSAYRKPPSILAPIPAISGSVRYGSRVTVRAGSWCPAATRLAYQWLRNGAPIAYDIAPDDIRPPWLRCADGHPEEGLDGLVAVVAFAAPAGLDALGVGVVEAGHVGDHGRAFGLVPARRGCGRRVG